MNLLADINRFIELLAETSRSVGRGRIWLPLILLGALKGLTLLALYKFLTPVTFPLVSSWLGLFPETYAVGFTHYPGHLLMLPYFFDWARFAVGLIMEGVIMAVVAMTFFDVYLNTPRQEQASWRYAWRSYLHLVVGWLLLNALMLAAAYLIPGWLESWLEGSPRRQLMIDVLLLPGLYILLVAVMYFVLPAVAIFGENAFRGLARSIRLFRRQPLITLALAALLMGLPIILALAAGQSALVVQKLRPELVFWILAIGIVVEIPVSFYWMGTSVRMLIDEDI